MVVLHVFLAGLFMYLCLRYLEPGRQIRVHAALAGAIAYMFSDLFIVHFGNLNLVAVAAWLPMIFLLFWRAQRVRSLGLAVAAGAVFGISTLEGHLQITLYIGLALVVATVVEAATARWSSLRWWLLASRRLCCYLPLSTRASVRAQNCPTRRRLVTLWSRGCWVRCWCLPCSAAASQACTGACGTASQWAIWASFP
jgi:hypothetical protein